MIYIERLHIENYKCFEKLDIQFQQNTNIIVGNNEAGKSTILEAVNLCLSGLIHNRYLRNELHEYFFNTTAIKAYQADVNAPLPSILIEVYLGSVDEDKNKNLEVLKGSRNTRKKNCPGVKLKICFDERYNDEYNLYLQAHQHTALPVEYYKIEWQSFAGGDITARSIPLKPNMIDASTAKYKNGGEYYLSKIIGNQLDKKEQIDLLQAIRELKDKFKREQALQVVNTKIAQCHKISDKAVTVSVNTTEINTWESILSTYIDEIPFEQIGQGEQSIIKTQLALSTIQADMANVLLIEEPENHLSHVNLNQLLKTIEENNSKYQIIVTTHSSFVANKLGLQSLLFVHGGKVSSFGGIDEDTQKYFKKLAGYDTLRLILSDRAILVEGPSDELIVQKAYQQKNNGRLPIQDGIDVIAVKGVQARRFLDMAKGLPIRIAVMTDNDGDYEHNIREKYKGYLSKTVQVFSNSNDIENTLEPSFVACNDAEDLKTFLGYTGKKPIQEYMADNKADWALQVFEADREFHYPAYIEDCINWIKQ